MRIITKKHLHDYAKKYPQAKPHIDSWIAEVEAAEWKNTNEVKEKYGNASAVGDRRIVFNIQGNHHRLIVAMSYTMQTVYIKFIGTHKEYDDVDAKTVEMKMED